MEENLAVVQGCLDEHGRVVFGRDVIVRAVGEHVLEVLRVLHRVAPLLPLARRERERVVKLRVDYVNEGHVGDDGLEEVGAHVRDRAHQESARRAARYHQTVFRRVARLNQILGGGDEVREGVLLRHHLSGVVPLLAEVAAAAYVGGGEDDAAVEK